MIASEVINQRLGGNIEQTKILDSLSAMERTYQETLLYAGSPPKDKLEDVLIKAGKAIEALFRFLNENYQRKDAWKIYNIPERQSRFEILNEIAKNLGFTTPLPYSLSGVSPTEIRRALESGGGTLGERVVATLLIDTMMLVTHSEKLLIYAGTILENCNSNALTRYECA
jgi:hypothetical protein